MVATALIVFFSLPAAVTAGAFRREVAGGQLDSMSTLPGILILYRIRLHLMSALSFLHSFILSFLHSTSLIQPLGIFDVHIGTSISFPHPSCVHPLYAAALGRVYLIITYFTSITIVHPFLINLFVQHYYIIAHSRLLSFRCVTFTYIFIS